MRRLLNAFWVDECGFVLSSELVLVSTTLVLGLTVALVAVREAIGGEFNDLANAFRGLDQSYYKAGIRGCRKPDGTLTSWTAGSGFIDPTLRTSGPNQEFFADDIDVGTYAHGGVPCQTPLQVVPAPTFEVAPCTTCPPLIVPPLEAPPSAVPTPAQPSEQLPIPALPELDVPATPAAPTTAIPCFSCLPGTNGQYAPNPISSLPSCAAPGNISGSGIQAQFVPVVSRYAPSALGPLQVW